MLTRTDDFPESSTGQAAVAESKPLDVKSPQYSTRKASPQLARYEVALGRYRLGLGVVRGAWS